MYTVLTIQCEAKQQEHIIAMNIKYCWCCLITCIYCKNNNIEKAKGSVNMIKTLIVINESSYKDEEEEERNSDFSKKIIWEKGQMPIYVYLYRV